MKNSVRLKCYKCHKIFYASLREIEFMQIDKCPECGNEITHEEKINLYYAVYNQIRENQHRFASTSTAT